MPRRQFKIYFSDFFNVAPEIISDYGSFNISLINDLPLFIDPILLYNSENERYQELHAEMIGYVQSLKSQSGEQSPFGNVKSCFFFPEIKQNWLGYPRKKKSY